MTWAIAALGDVCDIVSGATPRTSEEKFWGGNILWTTPKDLSGLDGAYLERPPRTITEEGLKSCAASLLPENSILLSSRAPIGLVAINAVPMATNQGFKSLVPDSRRVDSKFLFHWLKSKTSFLQGLGNGATFKEISKGVVERIEIPLPPLDEQRRIAAILDQADALCRQRKRALDLLDSLTQSIFLETIGRSVSRPARGLLELFDVTTGKLDSNAAKVGGEFPFFTCARELSWIDSYAFDCEALLLAGNNASADYSVKHYVGKFNAYQRTYVLRLKDSQNYCRFFKAALENRLSELKWRSKGTNTKYLTLKVLDELQVPTPDLKAQAWFNFLAEKIDAERSRMAAYMEQTRDLFVSLRHRAFSGQL